MFDIEYSFRKSGLRYGKLQAKRWISCTQTDWNVWSEIALTPSESMTVCFNNS